MTHSFPTRRSSDLGGGSGPGRIGPDRTRLRPHHPKVRSLCGHREGFRPCRAQIRPRSSNREGPSLLHGLAVGAGTYYPERSEEHTSELQSLMRISYAVFCLKKKKIIITNTNNTNRLY